MVDEMINDPLRNNSKSTMVVTEQTMKAIGFSAAEIDQARKPEGYDNGSVLFKICDGLPG